MLSAIFSVFPSRPLSPAPPSPPEKKNGRSGSRLSGPCLVSSRNPGLARGGWFFLGRRGFFGDPGVPVRVSSPPADRVSLGVGRFLQMGSLWLPRFALARRASFAGWAFFSEAKSPRRRFPPLSLTDGFRPHRNERMQALAGRRGCVAFSPLPSRVCPFFSPLPF